MIAFRASVPRHVYDDVLTALHLERARYASLLERYAHFTEHMAKQSAADAMALKRHEIGMTMPPDAAVTDTMTGLGPHAQLAIDEFAAGDPEMRKYLIGRAHLELAALRAHTDDPQELDDELAARIRLGDTA